MKPAELKQRLKDGKPVFGYMIWCMTGMRWKRVYAGCGLDFVVIDSEHGSRDRELIANTVEQFQSLDITAIVRTPSTDPIYVAMAMDAGADGVLVPYCEDIEEVKHCVGKLRTHPLKGEYYENYVSTGEFPSDKTKKYFEKLHKDHIFIMGVESKPAAENIGNMIDSAKIDGVFIGPNDMTTSLGIPNENDNPVYLETLKHVIGEADKRGVPTMIHQQTIPIAMGERLYTLYQFKDLLVNQGASYIRPDLSLAGGITNVKKISNMAEAFYAGVVPHNPLSCILTASCIQIDASVHNIPVQEYPYDDNLGIKKDLVDEPIKRIGGYLEIPNKPGIGVNLNEEAFKHYPPKHYERDPLIFYDGGLKDY